jgi:hypothetical protein
MKENPDPTEEGQLRYPATSGFFDIADFFVVRKGASRLVPCRCRPDCIETCMGSCGCQACAWRSAAEGQPLKRDRLKY